MPSLDDLVTVIIPTSPIPSHPSTVIIDECIGAIRHYFPAARLVILADGVRDQVKHREAQYGEYRERLQRRACGGEFAYSAFGAHHHQAGMLHAELPFVRTPLVLFVEHDAILRREPPIEWQEIFYTLIEGQADVVRFYNWAEVPWHEHAYLMRGEQFYGKVRFVRTVQFSGWPFVANTNYLRWLVGTISGQKRTMVEPAVYGAVCYNPWESNRILIYAPENAQTFLHRNGRLDERTGQRDPCDW